MDIWSRFLWKLLLIEWRPPPSKAVVGYKTHLTLEFGPDGDCHMISFFVSYSCTFLCFVFVVYLWTVTVFKKAIVTWYLCMYVLSSYSCTSKMSNWDSNLNRSTNKRLVLPPSQLMDELSEFQMVTSRHRLPRNKDISSDTTNGRIINIALHAERHWNWAQMHWNWAAVESYVPFPPPDCRLQRRDESKHVLTAFSSCNKPV